MSARQGRRMWLALSALVVIMLFATVAADAKLYGTRPPSSASITARASAAACPDGALCAQRNAPLRDSLALRTLVAHADLPVATQ